MHDATSRLFLFEKKSRPDAFLIILARFKRHFFKLPNVSRDEEVVKSKRWQEFDKLKNKKKNKQEIVKESEMRRKREKERDKYRGLRDAISVYIS